MATRILMACNATLTLACGQLLIGCSASPRLCGSIIWQLCSLPNLSSSDKDLQVNPAV